MAETSKFDLHEILPAHTALLKLLVIALTYTYERPDEALASLISQAKDDLDTLGANNQKATNGAKRYLDHFASTFFIPPDSMQTRQ